MIASAVKLLAFLYKAPQFIIPIYQRTYSWTEKQCRQLWDDIVRAGTHEDVPLHFVGSIVYVEQGLSQVSHQAPLLVIDGQQRLATLSLLIEALARAVGDSEPVEGFSAAKLRAYYLTNTLESGDRYFKLLLSQTDALTLKAIVRKAELPKEPSLRIIQNFELFIRLIAEQPHTLVAIYQGLAKLVVVDIALNRGQDNPQLIFESMNSTGKELSQADLIRNFVLMGLEPVLQTRLYEDYWRLMELDFGQEAYGTRFDGFMRHYLTVRSGEIPRESDVYEAFKDYASTKSVAEAGIEALVKDIRAFARYFCAMALGKETNPELGWAFHELQELKVDVAYPFLLTLYDDYAGGRFSAADFAAVVRLIEAYVFRRAVCAIPTNSMNKTFATFGKALKKERYLESIEAHFLSLPSYRRFPNDEEFRRSLLARDYSNFRGRTYLLRRLENHGRKERVPLEYTVEHILPQNPDLPIPWKQALGPEWQAVQQKWLHTLGNLTLTGCNPEYSDRPFAEKRDMTGGFKESPLRLNAELRHLDAWNETTIQERAARLADQALVVWPVPLLKTSTLATYQVAKVKTTGGYTIEDHPYLAKGSEANGRGMRALFEIFRKEVLALDPCVTEEFLKQYVAYKAETNFVDVVPQAKRLILSINLTYSEIDDPKKLCRDVSGIGRWGNGDVEVSLNSLDELPYAMGLVRQAFERQMSGGDES